MVRIKRKVEMALSELIEWGLENGIKSRRFTSNRLNSKYVGFDSLGGVCFNGLYSYLLEDTFTVEVEEEITEETKINKLVEVYRNIEDTILFTDLHHDYSISEVKDNEEYAVCSRAFYILNDDFNMTLIWKDGELVGDE
ncbi:hypothetical protein [Staphylococcus epidermidis]|uniref:hypothetical protein n=1 Tax=Staphylococcus epidermidis TaxID=1282 RepID=UPI00124D9E44|nr:hypothetical protein [Staphylococcus epidermidis]KAB2215119.1 hypothetical protein F9B25_10770 [Staphylococcus epidermidis]